MRLTQVDRPIMYGIVLPGPDVGEGIPILKGGNVRPSRLNLHSMARTTPEIEAPYARARLREGDLVYSIRGSIGDCEIVPPELAGSNITQDVARVAPRDGINPEWLRFALLSDPVREALASGSLGAAVRGINIFDLKRARIPVPPPEERAAIADYVRATLSGIESLSAEAEHAVALLKERRAALISAAVTGKIDVRGLVAPEEAKAA
jgi:type I restriction enzyme S subunit